MIFPILRIKFGVSCGLSVIQEFARCRQHLRSRQEASTFEPIGRAVPDLRDVAPESDAENVSPGASVTPQSCGSRQGDFPLSDCTTLWADFPRHLRRSPTPSSTSESSGTTADTFLLEDVSRSSFYLNRLGVLVPLLL